MAIQQSINSLLGTVAGSKYLKGMVSGINQANQTVSNLDLNEAARSRAMLSMQSAINSKIGVNEGLMKRFEQLTLEHREALENNKMMEEAMKRGVNYDHYKQIKDSLKGSETAVETKVMNTLKDFQDEKEEIKKDKIKQMLNDVKRGAK